MYHMVHVPHGTIDRRGRSSGPTTSDAESEAAAGRDRARARTRGRRPQPARPRRRDRHESPHAALPLRVEGRPPDRGRPRGRGRTAASYARRSRSIRRFRPPPWRVRCGRTFPTPRCGRTNGSSSRCTARRCRADRRPSSSSTASWSRGSTPIAAVRERQGVRAGRRACAGPPRASRSRAACCSTCSRPATAPEPNAAMEEFLALYEAALPRPSAGRGAQ